MMMFPPLLLLRSILRCSSLSFFSISKEARLKLLAEGRDAFVTINSQG
jgi:hypothetical protein